MIDDTRDRVAINDVMARYADGVNTRNTELWASTWHEDARWYLFDPEPTVGRDAIVAAWLEALKTFTRATMFVTQGSVQIDGDRAHGRSYNFEVGRTVAEKEVRFYSTYEDEYAKRDGVWAFTSRKFSMIHMEEF